MGLACGPVATAANAKDPHCIYPGDTVGVAASYRGDSVAACEPIIAERLQCFDAIVRPIDHAPCHVGQRSRRGAA